MSTTTQPEHGVLHYIRMEKRLHDLNKGIWRDPVAAGGIPMAINTKLSKALDAMSCIPFAKFPFYVNDKGRYSFTIGDAPAGSLFRPDVGLILQKSTPSAFGRGSETVLDPSYRNGREIPAASIGFKTVDVMNDLEEHVNSTIFPGRQITLKLYKLAVYETGGHFDWHMDSTHSDKHHGTLLVALNTSWEGGDLLLRRNGVETRVDLRPQGRFDSEDEEYLQAVAFFTDTEHCVEPVKDGVRIVLQYDIEIEKPGGKEVGEAKDDEDEDNKDEDDEDEEDEEKDGDYDPWMDRIASVYSSRMEAKGDAQAAADRATVEKVLTIIKELHSEGAKTVAFALQNLYRQASIRAEYLKGSDAVLYDALMASGDFDISLHPVVLREASGWEPDMQHRYAYRFDDNEEEDSPGSPEPPPRKKQKKKKSGASTQFHIPDLSAIQQISSQEYIEHTGNEAMPAEYRYFGGGMFVRPKAK